ncbi:hypothetical protein VKT23_008673 [Stygiomarasmius scandens]|uniref:Uncharacterized protein n=1 Tax=Marasmiellus scandens TaxID=2682957 RepID=A0ABR1JN87_9AGAR
MHPTSFLTFAILAVVSAKAAPVTESEPPTSSTEIETSHVASAPKVNFGKDERVPVGATHLHPSTFLSNSAEQDGGQSGDLHSRRGSFGVFGKGVAKGAGEGVVDGLSDMFSSTAATSAPVACARNVNKRFKFPGINNVGSTIGTVFGDSLEPQSEDSC